MHYKCCEIAVYLVRMNGFYCRSQCGDGGRGSGAARRGGGDVGCTTSVVVLITDCRRIAWCHSSCLVVLVHENL